MSSIYLAARFDRRAEMEKYADILKLDGHEITAQWVYGGEEGKSLEDIALMDWNDVMRADTLIQFTDPYGTAATGGGRHTEFGLAYGAGKRTLIVGEREQIFHNLPRVQQFNTLADAMEELRITGPKWEEMYA